MIEEETVPLSKELFYFGQQLLQYVFGKVLTLIKLLLSGFINVFKLSSIVKQRFVRRLIWRKGYLMRPVSHFGLISVASGILIFGWFFTSGNIFLSRENASAQVETASESDLMLVEQASSQTIIPENRGRDSVTKYAVVAGDTASSIAQKYNVSLETLLYVNSLRETDILAVGKELTILPVSGIYYDVKAGDSVETVASAYKIDAQTIVEVNWLEKPYTLEVGQQLVLPNVEPPKPVEVALPQYAAVTPAAPSEPIRGSGAFVWPVGGTMTRGYGWLSYGVYHNGLDLANSCGTAVVAADSGYVSVAGWRAGGYGITVWLNHGNGYESRYAHLSGTAISAGQYVSRGQVIGYIGNTGYSFGCHLHFMVERNGGEINPLSVL